MKLAFLFPGQGSQYPQMCKDFYDQYDEVKALFSKANKHLDWNLEELMFDSPKQVLQETRYSQVAIFVMSMAILNVVKTTFPSVEPFVCSGLSLGEYSALCASDKLDFLSCLELVKTRGELMQEASLLNQGGLFVVIGLDPSIVESCIKNIDGVWIANLNCPMQVVISGTHEGLKLAEKVLKESGARRVLPLDVSGAFHSGLMQYAFDHLKPKIDQSPLKESAIHFVMNVPGEIVDKTDLIKKNLTLQVVSTTRWEKGIRLIEQIPVDAYIEIGPGKTLIGMNRKIEVKAPSISVENIKDLDELQKLVLQNVT